MFLFISTFILQGCSSQAIINSSNYRWQEFPSEQTSFKINQIEEGIPNYHRLITRSYLTYPEWFIVYSSEEYASYLKSHLPSRFPYFFSIAQYWWGYHAMYSFTKNHLPSDSSDHVMLLVIGTSYSVEYLIKGLYEGSVGKLTELLSQNERTEEDMYAQNIAKDYARFILEAPWYDYSYLKALKGLWSKSTLLGPHIIRKTERKLIYTAEYGAKAVYAFIIRISSHLTYGLSTSRIYARIHHIQPCFYKKHSDIKLIKKINEREDIISLPSEQPFTWAMISLINNGAQFEDIAGNKEILVTAITRRSWAYKNDSAQLLFTINVLTHPKQHRIAIRVPVQSLASVLMYLQKNNAVIEHIYPY